MVRKSGHKCNKSGISRHLNRAKVLVDEKDQLTQFQQGLQHDGQGAIPIQHRRTHGVDGVLHQLAKKVPTMVRGAAAIKPLKIKSNG